jgi:hypothetical protein
MRTASIIILSVCIVIGALDRYTDILDKFMPDLFKPSPPLASHLVYFKAGGRANQIRLAAYLLHFPLVNQFITGQELKETAESLDPITTSVFARCCFVF